MASTINSTTTGVKITSDTSGALNIQVGGTNAIEIGANASVVIGNLALPTSLTLTTLNATSASITTLSATSLTVSSPQVFPAGSASAPAVTTTGDTNTGIYFPAADQVAVTTGGTVAAGFNSNGLFFRNRIINGDMRIDQRNAGAAVTISPTNFFTVDRWSASESSDATLTVQQDSSAPSGFVNSAKITVTVADASVAASQYNSFQQRIEGVNVADLAWGTASAAKVTLSFWVRSSVTGTFGGALTNSAYNRSYPFTYSISSANTWEQKSVTITGDTSGTWLTTTGIGISVYFDLGTGVDNTGTANAWVGAGNVGADSTVQLVNTLNATWYITGVQLETGSVATPFERRPYGTELMLCQRYYYRVKPNANSVNALGVGYADSTTFAVLKEFFPVPMRTAPTALEQSGTAGDYAVRVQGASAIACSAVPTFGSASTNETDYNFTVASGLTTGGGVFGRTGASTGANAYLGWSAEL